MRFKMNCDLEMLHLLNKKGECIAFQEYVENDFVYYIVIRKEYMMFTQKIVKQFLDYYKSKYKHNYRLMSIYFRYTLK